MATTSCVAFSSGLAFSYLVSANVRSNDEFRTTCISIFSNASVLSDAKAVEKATEIFLPSCAPYFDPLKRALGQASAK